jgi:putative transposase
MTRPFRIEFENGVYHVINRGSCKQNIFLDDSDYEDFMEILDNMTKIYGVQIISYCLMPNHFHILLRTPNANISRAMQYFASAYTQRFNRKWLRDGALFRGRFKSIIVDSDYYLATVSRYIHLNPVDSGLVDKPENWRWSSFNHLTSSSDNNSSSNVVDRNFALPFLGFSTSDYQDFVNQGNCVKTNKFYNKERLDPVFGRKTFKENVYKMIEKLDPSVPDQKRILDKPSVNKVIKKVSKILNTDKCFLKKAPKGQKKYQYARAMAIYLCRRKCQKNTTELAKIFNVSLGNSISAILSQFRKRLQKNPFIQDMLRIVSATI